MALKLVIDDREVVRNLNKAVARIQSRGGAGLLAAGRHVIAATRPFVPYSGDTDKEHLRDTGYAQPSAPSTLGPVVEVGYTAEYAPYVHEIEDVRFTTAGTEAKFLENGLRRETPAMLAIIAGSAKV